jgi:hypothetical protein
MSVLDNFREVKRAASTTYYPNFDSEVTRVTVTNENIYVDYVGSEYSNSGTGTDTYALSEFEAVMNNIYQPK